MCEMLTHLSSIIFAFEYQALKDEVIKMKIQMKNKDNLNEMPIKREISCLYSFYKSYKDNEWVSVFFFWQQIT